MGHELLGGVPVGGAGDRLGRRGARLVEGAVTQWHPQWTNFIHHGPLPKHGTTPPPTVGSQVLRGATYALIPRARAEAVTWIHQSPLPAGKPDTPPGKPKPGPLLVPSAPHTGGRWRAIAPIPSIWGRTNW
jgi:hypothetical protein